MATEVHGIETNGTGGLLTFSHGSLAASRRWNDGGCEEIEGGGARVSGEVRSKRRRLGWLG
jgi:hypothetical protein